jgi:hypothetical protein
MLSDLVLSGTHDYDDWDHIEAASRTRKAGTGTEFAASYDFENEFQFQLQGYAPAGRTVNREAHNRV